MRIKDLTDPSSVSAKTWTTGVRHAGYFIKMNVNLLSEMRCGMFPAHAIGNVKALIYQRQAKFPRTVQRIKRIGDDPSI